MGKSLVAGIIAVLVLISSVPFVDPAIKIQGIIYLGLPLTILIGSAGIAIIHRRIEAVICGIILSALLPVLLDAIK